MTTAPDNFDVYPEDQLWMDAQIAELTFGRRIKAHRLCEDWTQEQAAQNLGISKQLYNAYEKEQKFPTSEYKIPRLWTWPQRCPFWQRLTISEESSFAISYLLGRLD